MKCQEIEEAKETLLSLPVREVWIEISKRSRTRDAPTPSLPVREVWIEITYAPALNEMGMSSLPVREVWIEIEKQNRGKQNA